MVKGLSCQCRHHFGPLETGGPSRGFTKSKHHPPDAPSRKIRVGIHRADLGGVGYGVEWQGFARNNAIITAVKRCTPAPPSGPDNAALCFDNEIRLVFHQLGVEAHHMMAGADLLWRQKAMLQLLDCACHHIPKFGKILHLGKTVSKIGHDDNFNNRQRSP